MDGLEVSECPIRPGRCGPEAAAVEATWDSDTLFWCPQQQFRGFPVFMYAQTDAALLADMLKANDVPVEHMAPTLKEAGCLSFRHPTWVPSSYPHEPLNRDDLELAIAVAYYGVGLSGQNEWYRYFVTHEVARTEDHWSMISAYPWADLEVLLATGRANADSDNDRYRRAAAFMPRVWDMSEDTRALLKLGDADVWSSRELRFKQRHYYDVVTLLRTTHGEWLASGGENWARLFRRQIGTALCSMAAAGVNYERMYLQLAWLATCRYWPTLIPLMLRMGTLTFSDADFTAAHKEITAIVTQSWMLPLSNVQHLASCCFLNVEDQTGWSDGDSLKGEVIVESLRFATAHVENRMRDGLGNCTFEEYLRNFREGARRMLEPIWAAHGEKAETLMEHLAQRSAWAAGGANGRRARDILGPNRAPSGASKAFTMSMAHAHELASPWGALYVELAGKVNERGAERTLAATDLHDQLAESLLYHIMRNRYPMVGGDIGESPLDAAYRHVRMSGASVGPSQHFPRKPVLSAYDYSKFDHNVSMAEHLAVLEVMADLVRQYARPEAQRDLLAAVAELTAGHRDCIFRSQAFADPVFGPKADALAASTAGRAERLGPDSFRMTDPNGQQSGRRSTLELNTIISRARLHCRDVERGAAEEDGGRALQSAENKGPIFQLNRSDDVMELYLRLADAADSIAVMGRQGHKANPKKQVVQYRTGIYFRVLYANGAVLGFPARSIYAAFSAPPAIGKPAPGISDKLRSLSEGLDRLARRGSSYAMARALYFEAERYYRKIRLPRATLGARDPQPPVRYVSIGALRTPPEQGGLGVLPPGEYRYDLGWTARPTREAQLQSAAWRQRAAARSSRYRMPGVHDLAAHSQKWFEESTGVKAPDQALRSFRRRWRDSRAQADGKGEIATANSLAGQWGQVRTAHRIREHAEYTPRMSVGAAQVAREAIDTAFYVASAFPRQGQAVRDYLRPLQTVPGSGVLQRVWAGLGADVVAASSGSRRQALAEELAMKTKQGMDFMAAYGGLSQTATYLHLHGKLGPAGAWMSIIPASWSALLTGMVDLMFWETMADQPTESTYRIWRRRLQLTDLAASFLLLQYPEKMLH